MEKVGVFQSPARFLAYLNHYFWLSAKFYNSEHLRNYVLPRLVSIQEKVALISRVAYGLIANGWYDRAYLSELNHLITEFVRECEEINECSDCSEEDKVSKFESLVYAFSLRLVALEYEIKRDYIKKTLEDYLEAHKSVLGSDFTLLDLYRVLGRIVEDEFGFEKEENPLTEG
jgi:hypothetical protein